MDINNYVCVCGKTIQLRFKSIHSSVCPAFCSVSNQTDYLALYKKRSIHNITYIHGIPKVVFICWFGTESNPNPQMSPNRFDAFKSIVKHIRVPIILITDENVDCFIKYGHPIHPAFKYLSGVHKSDYIRCYLLMHYGGGYHDIKFRDSAWTSCWDEDNWLEDKNIWMYGRKEKNMGAIGHPPGEDGIKTMYDKLATMCWIICKPNTPYLIELNNSINSILDKHIDALKQCPGENPGGYYSENPFSMADPNIYPIRWLELLGEIFHPLMLKYTDHIKFGLPDALKKRYR